MSIQAINEQLLRTIGVGIAIVRSKDLRFVFANSAFDEWFGRQDDDCTLPEVIEGITKEDIERVTHGGERFNCEVQFKKGRRTIAVSIALSFARSGSESLVVVECQNITRVRELEAMIDSYSNMVERNTRELEREKERVERLLLNLMPKSVYEEFKTFGVVTPQLYKNVSVVMLDFVDFTDFAARTDPTVTLSELNDIFTAFDRITEQYGCERIKTIGDAYLGGLWNAGPGPGSHDGCGALRRAVPAIRGTAKPKSYPSVARAGGSGHWRRSWFGCWHSKIRLRRVWTSREYRVAPAGFCQPDAYCGARRDEV